MATERIPSEEEQANYYEGLASRPRLVARSNWQTVWHPRNEDNHPVQKRLANIGRHPIINAWNNTSLCGAIMGILDDLADGWNYLDPLRIGYEDEEDKTMALGFKIASMCHDILKAHGINDVHCEIRETLVKTAAGSPLVIPALDVSGAALGGSHFMDFTQTIGQSIALETNPAREATLTCYLALAEKRDLAPKCYALISRHLPFPEGEGKDDKSYRHTASGRKQYIIMPGDRTLKEARQTVENDLKSWEDRIQAVQDSPSMLKIAKEQFRITEVFKKHLQSLEKPESRRIGYVVYSPARLPGEEKKDSTGTESLNKISWLPDYAIVALDTARIKSPCLPDLRNVVYLKDQYGIPKELNADLGAVNRYRLPENNEPLHLNGVVPVAELYKPTARYGRQNYTTGDFVIRVSKRGRTTGLTWGEGNQITSVTRVRANGRDVKALHWTVQSLNLTPFSARGDSGAAVFTPHGVDGRLVAMIDGGSGIGRLDQFDVTYTTPLEWIREDLKRNVFESVSFL